MKKISKITSLVLSLATVSTIAAVPAGAKYFSDVSIGHWARESINYASENGFIDSASSSTFDPDGTFTRADVAEMLYRFDGEPSVSVTNKFTDISSGASYAKAVSWMSENGIMNGTSSTTFEPSTGIKRQDLAVTFYRYASYVDSSGGYIKHNVLSKSADITDFSDYSKVNAYARDAMSWAVGVKLITGEVGGVLEPRKIVVRETGAEFLKRYGLFVQGINWGYDNYSFINSSGNFLSKCYISQKHLEILENICKLSGESALYNSYFKSYPEKSWSGACHGLSLSLILDKVGKLNINGALKLSSTSLYALPKPLDSTNYELVSIINFYHSLQGVSSLISEFHDNSSKNHTWSTYSEILKKQIDNYGLLQLGIQFTSGGWHAIVVYDYSESSSAYTFYAFDPNYGIGSTSDSATKLILTKDDKSCTLNNGSNRSEIATLEFASDFQNPTSLYSVYDLDSYYNDFNAGNSSMSSDFTSEIINATYTDRDETMFLSVDGSNNFSITNAEGENIVCTDGIFYGNLNIVTRVCFPDEKGNITKYILKVPNSEHFIFESADDFKEFSYMNGNLLASARGKGFDKITIHDNTDIYIEGSEKLSYTLNVSNNISAEKLIEVVGESEKNVSLVSDNLDIILKNSSGRCSVANNIIH